MTQYSKRMVIVHWLTLALVIVAWYLGHELDEAATKRVQRLSGTLRMRWWAARCCCLPWRAIFPQQGRHAAAMGAALLDKVAKGIHHGLYAVLILLSASGIMTVATSSVGKALLAGDATLLPKKFTGVAPHDVHEILVTVLIVLVRRRGTGWLGVERSFRFEYSEDGQDRHVGRVVLLGEKLVGFSGPSRAAQAVVRSFPLH